MSFGFSAGDFIAVGRLAINLYNACASAPAEFQELCRDLSSIHTVICGLQSQAEDPNSILRRRCDDRTNEWARLKENLEGTLLELQGLLKRFDKMGRNAWKRVRLGLEDLNDLRGKLIVHLNSINAFVGSLSLSALGRIEPALGRIERLLAEFLEEERLGHKAPTVLSAHEEGSGPAWKQMELDLLLCGISKQDLERNEERIRELLAWVVNNERDLVDLHDIEVGESISQRPSFEAESTVLGPTAEESEFVPEYVSRDFRSSSMAGPSNTIQTRVESSPHTRRDQPELRSNIVNTTPVAGIENNEQREEAYSQTNLSEETYVGDIYSEPERIHETADYATIGQALSPEDFSQNSQLENSNQHLSENSNYFSTLGNESQNDAATDGLGIVQPSSITELPSSHTENHPDFSRNVIDANSMHGVIEEAVESFMSEMDGVANFATYMMRGGYLENIVKSIKRGESKESLRALQLITQNMQHAGSSFNFKEIRWAIILARNIYYQLWKHSRYYSERTIDNFRSTLFQLVSYYERLKQTLRDWNSDLPPDMQMWVMEAQQTRHTSSASDQLRLHGTLEVKILIIDHEVSHFGFMFERELKITGSNWVTPPSSTGEWCFTAQVHHFSSNLVNNADLTEKDQKTIHRTKAALDEYHQHDDESLSVPEAIYPYCRPEQGYLTFYEYDFILLVQPRSGAFYYNSPINTPFGAPFGGELATRLITYSDLKKSGIVFDALDFDKKSSIKNELELPFSKGPGTLLSNLRFLKAKQQIRECVKRFCQTKLNAVSGRLQHWESNHTLDLGWEHDSRWRRNVWAELAIDKGHAFFNSVESQMSESQKEAIYKAVTKPIPKD